MAGWITKIRNKSIRHVWRLVRLSNTAALCGSRYLAVPAAAARAAEVAWILDMCCKPIHSARFGGFQAVPGGGCRRSSRASWRAVPGSGGRRGGPNQEWAQICCCGNWLAAGSPPAASSWSGWSCEDRLPAVLWWEPCPPGRRRCGCRQSCRRGWGRSSSSWRVRALPWSSWRSLTVYLLLRQTAMWRSRGGPPSCCWDPPGRTGTASLRRPLYGRAGTRLRSGLDRRSTVSERKAAPPPRCNL